MKSLIIDAGPIEAATLAVRAFARTLRNNTIRQLAKVLPLLRRRQPPRAVMVIDAARLAPTLPYCGAYPATRTQAETAKRHMRRRRQIFGSAHLTAADREAIDAAAAKRLRRGRAAD